jgi:single-strand DNA-binding protein
MSLALNTVILAGRLTRDPEVKTLPGDKAVVSFSLAINRRFKGADGELKEEVTFVDCEAWNRLAELVGQYLVKGSGCYLEGRLKLDSWQDKDGKPRSRLKVVAETVQFMDKPKAKDGATSEDDTVAPARTGGPANTARPARSAPAKIGVAITGEEPPF